MADYNGYSKPIAMFNKIETEDGVPLPVLRGSVKTIMWDNPEKEGNDKRDFKQVFDINSTCKDCNCFNADIGGGTFEVSEMGFLRAGFFNYCGGGDNKYNLFGADNDYTGTNMNPFIYYKSLYFNEGASVLSFGSKILSTPYAHPHLPEFTGNPVPFNSDLFYFIFKRTNMPACRMFLRFYDIEGYQLKLGNSNNGGVLIHQERDPNGGWASFNLPAGSGRTAFPFEFQPETEQAVSDGQGNWVTRFPVYIEMGTNLSEETVRYGITWGFNGYSIGYVSLDLKGVEIKKDESIIIGTETFDNTDVPREFDKVEIARLAVKHPNPDWYVADWQNGAPIFEYKLKYYFFRHELHKNVTQVSQAYIQDPYWVWSPQYITYRIYGGQFPTRVSDEMIASGIVTFRRAAERIQFGGQDYMGWRDRVSFDQDLTFRKSMVFPTAGSYAAHSDQYYTPYGTAMRAEKSWVSYRVLNSRLDFGGECEELLENEFCESENAISVNNNVGRNRGFRLQHQIDLSEMLRRYKKGGNQDERQNWLAAASSGGQCFPIGIQDFGNTFYYIHMSRNTFFLHHNYVPEMTALLRLHCEYEGGCWSDSQQYVPWSVTPYEFFYNWNNIFPTPNTTDYTTGYQQAVAPGVDTEFQNLCVKIYEDLSDCEFIAERANNNKVADCKACFESSPIIQCSKEELKANGLDLEQREARCSADWCPYYKGTGTPTTFEYKGDLP